MLIFSAINSNSYYYHKIKYEGDLWIYSGSYVCIY